MNETDWIGLLVQVPLVGLFIWFTLQMLKGQASERAVRDKEWRSFLEVQNGNFIAFLEQERAKSTEAFGRIFTELNRIHCVLAEYTTMMQRHDERMDSFTTDAVSSLHLIRDSVVSSKKEDRKEQVK